MVYGDTMGFGVPFWGTLMIRIITVVVGLEWCSPYLEKQPQMGINKEGEGGNRMIGSFILR